MQFERVYVEIHNVCNLQCSFCPPVERGKKQMTVEFFARVAGELRGRTREICLHLMGEPLAHPHLKEVVAVAEAHELAIQLTTNGTLLSEQVAAICAKPIIRQVNFSLQSFEANFAGRDATTYVRKIFSFVDHLTAKRPELYVNFRLWDLGAEPRNAQVRRLLEEHYEFAFAALHFDLRRKKRQRLRGRVSVHLDSSFEWPSLKQEMRSTTGFCHALSQHIGIHADGTVVPCCLDKEAVLALGNLHDASLSQILESHRAREMRAGFAHHELREELCQKCEFIQRFARKSRPSAHV